MSVADESERLYRALVELSPEALAVHRQGKLLYVNPAAIRMFGATDSDELVGRSILELVHPDSQGIAVSRLNETRELGVTGPMTAIRLAGLDGTSRDVEIHGTTIVYDGAPALLEALRDVTQAKAHKIEIERLSRLYFARSRVNQAIVRMPNRNDLFQSICRILVDYGGMRMARISWHASETRELIDVAAAGDIRDYPLQRLPILPADSPQARSPSGTAFRQERPYVCNDMLLEPLTLPWRNQVAGRDFRSCAAFPFREKILVSGVLTVYAVEMDFFKDKEIGLLEETAHDISFALDNLVREDVRHQAEAAAQRSMIEAEVAELALRVERDRAQRYLDTAEAILLALDLQGRITLVNRYACTVFGWTAEELIGRDFIETCVPAAIRDETRMKLGNVLNGPDSSVVENAIVTKSGEIRLIEWRNTLLRDDQGRVASTLSSGIDLTDRNAAIEALRTGEERMRFALQTANVGIWDMDYTTGVLQWSETLETQYGFAPGTFDGKFESFIALTHPDDRAEILETLERAVKSGADFTTNHRAVWPDGTIRQLNGAGRILLDEHGEPVRGIGISLDITERRILEEQFQQAQKMDAIGRLAGGVAHDFNNLLTAILGYCELLLSDFGPDDPRQSDIEEIQKAGRSAAGLTRQLLAFSRKQIIELKMLDLNEIVGTMHSMLGRLIGENVSIEVALMTEPALIRADRAQVEQVVMNLALNARDAMPTGGSLTLETACVELDEHYARTHFSVMPGRYVMLTVSDTGSGMTPEVQNRIFEPFFTTKEVGKGTGLGLATVHGIVARSGGIVNVYSEVGMGTSFKAYFPRVDAVEPVVEAAHPAARSRAGGHTVLVVEDADGLRELARRLLQRLGYTVLVAANADQAIRLFEQNTSIDLLLTDVVMPGASGPELGRQLVERRPGLKVIYMSGYTDEAIVHHGVLKPGIALLNKPFTSEALSRKIREVLN